MSAVYAGENVIVVTGLPGNGKTLYALQMCDEIARATSRPVFTCGVNGIAREDWKVLEDGQRWMDCPAGSIILIDEGQRIFEPAGPGQRMPPHLSEMNTIRHRGLLLVITTQHPHLLHMNVRKLCQRHFHVVRKFGWDRADVYHWGMCADVGTRNALITSCKQASRIVWTYPKEVYGWYKSSELHTVQKKTPWQVWALIICPLIIAALVVVAVYSMKKVSAAPEKVGKQIGDQITSPARASAGGSAATGSKAPLSPEDWMAARQPRVQGFAYTAPAYDDVTRPVRAPYPAACVSARTKCRCYSQQGTRLDVPKDTCEQIADRGFFVDFDDKKQDLSANDQARRGSSGDSRADSTAPDPSDSPRSAGISDAGQYPGPRKTDLSLSGTRI